MRSRQRKCKVLNSELLGRGGMWKTRGQFSQTRRERQGVRGCLGPQASQGWEEENQSVWASIMCQAPHVSHYIYST